uniref:Glycosyltransferase n=1 Tax=Ignisphaera aggregans TaxID=334771 RepID=A0A7C4FHG1_9CREN
MIIALIRRGYITHLDGVNRFIALLAEGFAKLGHEPIIVSWCYSGVNRARLEEWFKEVHGLDNPLPIYTLRSGPCEGDPRLAIAWDWWSKGSRLLHKEGVEAAVVNEVVPLRFRHKIVVNHGITIRPNRLYLLIVRKLYRGYDKVICVSNKLRDEVRKVLGVDCDVIPLPLKLDLCRPVEHHDRENIVVHIGTRPVKNPWISIEAIKILRTRGHNIKLVVIGPSSSLPKVEGVEYKYAIPEEEKLELICRSKALILPSSYEALPYTTLEATACGTPVVVSSAIPEEAVIDGFNGIRVNSFDPQDYANALERLLLDEELWLRLSKNGLEFVKQFNYIEISKRYINIIHELL